LSPEQCEQIMRRLPHEPALRSAVEKWEARLLPLTTLVEPQTPSVELWPRIMSSLQAESLIQRWQIWRDWWSNVVLWRSLSAGGFAAAAILGAMVLMRPAVNPTGAPTYMVVLVAPQDRTPGWVVQTRGGRELTLTPLVDVAVSQQQALQFWTKGEGWKAPVSLGLVLPGKSLQVELDKLPLLQPNQLFEITLEPASGSPTGRPTGPILYVGKAVKTQRDT